MNQKQENLRQPELQSFNRLCASSSLKSITDAYDRVRSIVQAMMLNSDNPDAHARAWRLLNDDAYKDLSDIQEGKTVALANLDVKISQVGELLLNPEG